MRPPAADRLSRRRPPLALLAASAAIASACASAPRVPPRPPPMSVVVQASAAANDGQPFYVVFQAVSERDFATQSYRAASELAFTSGPGVLATAVVLPDREQSIAVATQEKDAVAAYFLFTRPGRSWKVLLRQPLAARHAIAVGASDVELVR